jgi:hypothetical protein
MRFFRIQRLSMLQLVVIALLAVLHVEATKKVPPDEPDPVYEPVKGGIPNCRKGCVKNRKGQWVCRSGGQIITCPGPLGPLDTEIEHSDGSTLGDGPKSPTTLDDKDDDPQYAYDDVTFVLDYDTAPSPAPDALPSSPPNPEDAQDLAPAPVPR